MYLVDREEKEMKSEKEKKEKFSIDTFGSF
jgi:hypothetical protein